MGGSDVEELRNPGVQEETARLYPEADHPMASEYCAKGVNLVATHLQIDHSRSFAESQLLYQLVSSGTSDVSPFKSQPAHHTANHIVLIVAILRRVHNTANAVARRDIRRSN
jgi:hypothetical protein